MPVWSRSEGVGRGVVLPLLAMATLACSNYQPPDLKTLYDQVARYHDQHRNPVVVIPGILGTRLVDETSDRVVWGAFGGGAVSPGFQGHQPALASGIAGSGL